MRAVQRQPEGQHLTRGNDARAVKLGLHLLPRKPCVDQAFHSQGFRQIDGQLHLGPRAILRQAVAHGRDVVGPDAQLHGHAVANVVFQPVGDRNAGAIGQTHGPALDGAGQQVHRRAADEGGDKGGDRVVEHLHRGADLFDMAVLHHHDPVGQGHRLDLVMGDIDDRGLHLLVQLLDLGPHLAAQLGVKVRQGLVEQERIRVPHDGAAHRHPLALAA
jgi:hypothetical protein